MNEPVVDVTFIVRLTTSDPEGWLAALRLLVADSGTIENAADETGRWEDGPPAPYSTEWLDNA